MKQIIYTIWAVILFTACSNKSVVVYDLKCENLKNPVAVDNLIPRFSWKIESGRNETQQVAFQILAASSKEFLQEGKADFWDSGKINSSESIWVKYKGKSLNPGDFIYWKVRVWDEKGISSVWSPVEEFGIGLLEKKDWQADYIGFQTENGFNDCPILKKEFNYSSKKGKLLLHVNSLGYHEVFLNGRKIDDKVLSPAVSQFNKRSLIVTTDITSIVKEGTNKLEIWLGSGWYSEGFPGVTNRGPLVKAQLEQVSDKNRLLIIKTDSTWMGKSSCYSRVGNWHPNNFGGEILNGNLAENEKNESKSDWKQVAVVSVPDHEVTPQMTEPNRVIETIHPVSVEKIAKDTFLVDMGKSITGWIEVRFPKLNKLQEITMDYCDHLDKNGEFIHRNQTDRYIASGIGDESFINKFNYHGFRYIRISNLSEIPLSESIKAMLIHTGYQAESGFECSDKDLNQVHNLVQYTLRCLSLGGYLVDCPQIERLGYGGDGNASTLTAQTMFNLSGLYSNWLQAWGDCVREDGGMPHTAPNPYKAGGGPYWCGFIITASWNTFVNYGDTAVLQKYYPVMQKWIGYVDKYSVDGLLKKWPDLDYRGWYLGDWAVPKGVDQTNVSSVDLVNNCFVSVCYEKMEKIASVLGKNSDRELYQHKSKEIRELIHSTFWNGKDNYATGSQIDLAYPLLSEVVPDAEKQEVINSLVREIEITQKGHFATGLVGIPVFTEWVTREKEVNLMYNMLKKREYPGYLYMIDNGATTTWEHWDGARSRIHNCYNGIGSWFYQALGGIRSMDKNSAYREVVIEPQIPDGVNWVKTWKETPFGKLSVNWKKGNETLDIELIIPVGIKANVILPEGTQTYRLNRKQYKYLPQTNGILRLGSGKYKLSCKIR